MNRIALTIAILLAAAPVSAFASTGCDGPDPAVTSVSLRNVSHTPYLNLYHVTATITNLGSQSEAGDALQFVDVMQYGGRLDDRGVPPLAPGESYTVSYTWPRSSDAGKWTSPLNFRVRTITSPGGTCAAGKTSAGITV